MSTKLVIYHKRSNGVCMDGFGAALAAYMHDDWKDAVFLAMKYNDIPPDVIDLDVLIVDFSFDRETLIKLHNKAKSLLVIDHHKERAAELEGLDFCIFDMEKSGAVLTWQELHGYVPLIMQYIGDRDLWKFEMEFCKDVNAALYALPKSFKYWSDNLIYFSTDGFKQIVDQGKTILAFQQQIVKEVVVEWHNDPVFFNIGNEIVPLINCSLFISEVLHELAENYPFAVSYVDAGNFRTYSLRSRSAKNNTDVQYDCGRLAASFGGGGHMGSAGFKIPLDGLVVHKHTMDFIRGTIERHDWDIAVNPISEIKDVLVC